MIKKLSGDAVSASPLFWLLRDRQPPAMPVEIKELPAKKPPMIE